MKLSLKFNRDWPPEGTHVIVISTTGTLEVATVCSHYQGGFVRGHIQPVAGVYFGPALCDGFFEVRAWAVIDRDEIQEMLY